MKWTLVILGVIGIANFLSFVEVLRPVKTVPAAVFNGLSIVAIALFTGLCFVGAAIIEAADKVAAARRAQEDTNPSSALPRRGAA